MYACMYMYISGGPDSSAPCAATYKIYFAPCGTLARTSYKPPFETVPLLSCWVFAMETLVSWAAQTCLVHLCLAKQFLSCHVIISCLKHCVFRNWNIEKIEYFVGCNMPSVNLLSICLFQLLMPTPIVWHVCRKTELWSQQRQPLFGNVSEDTPILRRWRNENL
jgi:hypothetical protein